MVKKKSYIIISPQRILQIKYLCHLF